MHEFFLDFKLTRQVGKERVKDFKSTLDSIKHRIYCIEKERKEREERKLETIVYYKSKETKIKNSNLPMSEKKALIKQNTEECIKKVVDRAYQDKKVIDTSLTKEEIEKNSKLYRLKTEMCYNHRDCNVVSNNGMCIFCGKKTDNAKIKFNLRVSNKLLIKYMKIYFRITKNEKDYDEFINLFNILK